MKIAAALLLLLPLTVRADEGMWTFDNIPRDALKKTHGVAVDDAWVEHLRLSSVRLTQGCSGGFVSPDGLVMTNAHCVLACVSLLSSPEKDYQKDGFVARTLADEAKCVDMEINQLVSITDVTPRITRATADLAGARYNAAERAESLRIESECATGADVRCDVVSLYGGGLHHLYKYRRFQDVRLAFSPEQGAAFFGGDPDNFNFPRFNLDVAFIRVWQGDKPLDTKAHHMPWSAAGAKEGEVAFISGHPGTTRRQFTIAQLEYVRDVQSPDTLMRLAEQRGMLTEYQRRGPEQKRHSSDTLLTIENAYKAVRGGHRALLDRDFFGRLVAREKELRAAVAARPELQKQYGDAWDGIATAMERIRALRDEYNQLEAGSAFSSDLFGVARLLVRAAAERPKTVESRLREFSEAAMPAMEQSLLSPAPIYDELEIALLTFSLTKLREVLGADHPTVKKVLGKESPEAMAERLVKGTKLGNVEVRKALWTGGQKAVEASDDPMIELARRIDSDARALRARFESEYDAPLRVHAAKLARARFAVYGTSIYPDATFTLRFNYGQVKGWTEPGKTITPFTTLAGAFERATGYEPYALPERWLRARDSLSSQTPFNFTTDNDSVGGNSGSPVVNARAEIVGVLFDGNLHSLGGDFGFDPEKNRAIAVHSEAIREVLSKVYGAERLVAELTGKPAR